MSDDIEFEVFCDNRGKTINSGVYIAIDASGKLFKIGRSDNILKREREIRNMNPEFLVLFSVRFRMLTAEELERSLHRLFSDKRVSGEWFDLSNQDVADILGVKELFVIDTIVGMSRFKLHETTEKNKRNFIQRNRLWENKMEKL